MYLSEECDPDPTSKPPRLNGPILVNANILKLVMSSAAEAEIAACFCNCQDACPIRVTLEEMGYPQGTTTCITDNKCAEGYAQDTIKQKKSKAMDMRFHWIKCRSRQEQFKVIWKDNKNNMADYHTKHHSPAHHKEMRPLHLYVPGKSKL